LKSRKLFVDGQTYGRAEGHLRPTLLGGLNGVDLKSGHSVCNTSCQISLKRSVKYMTFGSLKHKKPVSSQTSSGFSCGAYGTPPVLRVWNGGRWQNDSVKGKG